MKLFGSHFHIIDPRFPLIPNNGYMPPEFTTSHYLAKMAKLDIWGGAVVSGSFQAFDQTYLINALKELGPKYVGVTQIPVSTTKDEVLSLHQHGVRAVRFNLKRGGSAGVKDIEVLSSRVQEWAGWHSEFYVDSRELDELSPLLSGLKQVCVDHLGVSKEGLPHLKKLVEKGAFVKVTFGRVEFEVIPVIKELAAINENALVFGTDLPGTRAKRLFEDSDLQTLVDGLGEKLTQKILFDNAFKLYRLKE